MIEDGHDGLYDPAIVITNDGDLEDALRYVLIKIDFVNPPPTSNSQIHCKDPLCSMQF